MLKKLLVSLAVFLIIAGLVYQASSRFRAVKETDFNSIKILDMDTTGQNSGVAGVGLRVISANLIAEFDSSSVGEGLRPAPTDNATDSGTLQESESTPSATSTSIPISKIKTLRILGELQNTGTKNVGNATPIIIFYDLQNKKLASKVAGWSENYTFPVLKPKEKFLYDVILTSLPEGFANLSINFKPISHLSNSRDLRYLSRNLKITGRDIEEKAATASSGQTVVYYQLRGKMVNAGKKSVKNTSVVAYGKDSDNRVFTWGNQDFPSDLFSPRQKQDILISLFPLKDARLETAEVFLFGEEI